MPLVASIPEEFNYLSLISKVCTELETHLGTGDKALAEFIIELARNSDSLDEFDVKLKENGAEFPDYFVRTLFTIIHSILPPKGLSDRVRTTELKDRGGYGDEGDRRGGGGRRNDWNYSTEPELREIYKGRVSRVMDTGAFVELDDIRGKEGLVHVSQMVTRRVVSAKDVVKRDQEVYVKVISVSGQKLSLSMRDVDQNTGRDLQPLKERPENDALRSNPSGSKGPTSRVGLSGIRIVEEDRSGSSRRPLKRMSSPEIWEAKQLIAAGVMSVKDYPLYGEEGDELVQHREEELEIELNEDEPHFLQGRTRYSADTSPVKIYKNPEGSLSRAAALQSALIKERREVREQQQRTMLDSIPKDLNRPWEDPMPETGERHLAQELRGVGLSAYDMPEWKKEAYGKAVTFGQKSKL